MDIDIILQRTDASGWRLIYEIKPRWVKNNRDPEDIVCDGHVAFTFFQLAESGICYSFVQGEDCFVRPHSPKATELNFSRSGTDTSPSSAFLTAPMPA